MNVIFNGQIVSREDVKIDMEDRGYQFGDAIYEVIGVYNGKCFKLEDHIKRFQRSAHKLSIPFVYHPRMLAEKLETLKSMNQLSNGMIYMQMSRGVAARSHPFPQTATIPVLIAYTKEAERPFNLQKEGVHCILTEDIRWLRCDIKTVNLLGSVLAKQMAIRNNCYEAILHRGELVTEGASTNVFIIKDRVVYTHPANNFILNGITRMVVIDICKDMKIPLEEKAFTIDELFQADEVFITGTYSNILPVIQIADTFIGDGKPGPLTRLLQTEFKELIHQ